MGTNVNQVASSTPAKGAEQAAFKVPEEITADERYGTFKELVAELNKRGSLAEKESNGNKRMTTYRDADGTVIGGTYTYTTSDGKISGSVAIGNLSYSVKDIQGEGKVTSILNSKKGTFARDYNDDGIINPFEISHLGPLEITNDNNEAEVTEENNQ